MLPQKFSPAITLIALDNWLLGAGPPHAQASATRTQTAANFTRPVMTQEYCTIDLRNVFAYSRGMARPSPVSDQVKSLFSDQDRHLWSIDELHAAVVAQLGAADYSTVFRAVSGLEKDGAIHRIDLGDGKVHYELAEEHHEHIRCDSCGRVVEVPGCVLEDASTAVTNSTGFKVTSHQLLFSGVCPACASAR
jgi:Fe2+ or Zn2+ uptake regulation protein